MSYTEGLLNGFGALTRETGKYGDRTGPFFTNDQILAQVMNVWDTRNDVQEIFIQRYYLDKNMFSLEDLLTEEKNI